MTSMNVNHLVSLLQEDYTTIEVVFRNSSGTSAKNYIYKAKRSYNLAIGDCVVVVSYLGHYTTAFVVAVHAEPQIDTSSDITYRWIVDKVDESTYQALQEAEEQATRILQEVEREKVREQAVKDIKASLKRGSKAAKLFNQAQNLLK